MASPSSARKNRKRKQRLALGLVGLIAAVLVFALLSYAIGLKRLDSDLRANGVTTVATMTNTGSLYGYRVGMRSSTTAEITFMDQSGAERHEQIRVDSATVQMFRSGQREFLIRYDPNNPSRALVAQAPGFAESEMLYGAVFGVFFVVVFGLAGLISYQERRRRRQARELRQKG